MPEHSEHGRGAPGSDGPGSNGPGSSGREATPEQDRQLELMQRMVELSVQRTTLAEQRTEMAQARTRMAADRSEMSAERSYMNAERTLSVWIRTSLAVMVVGIAVDRFGLFLLQNPVRDHGGAASDWSGVGLVALGVLIAVVPGVRFRRYAAVYRRTHTLPHHHGPFMAPMFAILVAVFGMLLLVLLIAAAA